MPHLLRLDGTEFVPGGTEGQQWAALHDAVAVWYEREQYRARGIPFRPTPVVKRTQTTSLCRLGRHDDCAWMGHDAEDCDCACHPRSA